MRTLLFFITAVVLISCKKNSNLDIPPAQQPTAIISPVSDAARLAGDCPVYSRLNQGIGIAYHENGITSSLVNLDLTITYSSLAANGSFKIVLKDKNGHKIPNQYADNYPVSQTPADGTPGMFTLNYHVHRKKFPLSITKIDGSTNVSGCTKITHYSDLPFIINLYPPGS